MIARSASNESSGASRIVASFFASENRSSNRSSLFSTSSAISGLGFSACVLSNDRETRFAYSLSSSGADIGFRRPFSTRNSRCLEPFNAKTRQYLTRVWKGKVAQTSQMGPAPVDKIEKGDIRYSKRLTAGTLNGGIDRIHRYQRNRSRNRTANSTPPHLPAM